MYDSATNHMHKTALQPNVFISAFYLDYGARLSKQRRWLDLASNAGSKTH